MKIWEAVFPPKKSTAFYLITIVFFQKKYFCLVSFFLSNEYSDSCCRMTGIKVKKKDLVSAFQKYYIVDLVTLSYTVLIIWQILQTDPQSLAPIVLYEVGKSTVQLFENGRRAEKLN